MLIGILVDAGDIEDIRRGIGQLQQWVAALEGGDPRRQALREVLGMEVSRVVRQAYAHFGTRRFSLAELARRTGEDLSVVQGLMGSLGLTCRRRGIRMFDRHGGDPPLRSVRREVAELLEAQGPAAAAR